MEVPINGIATDDPEEYEYDLDEALQQYDWSELVPVAIVYGLVLIVGLVGNVLVILTIVQHRRMKTITNIFLVSLASADLLLVLVCIPVNVAKLFSYTWTFGPYVCKGVHYMQNLSAICSVLTLTSMSVERYYAIVHPIKAQYLCTISQAKKVIIFTWIAAFVLAMPTLIVQTQLEVGNRRKAYWCVRDYKEPELWKPHEIYMLLIVLVIPSTIMAGAYAAIGFEIWTVLKQRSAMTHRGHGQIEFPVDPKFTVVHRSQLEKDTVRQVIYMLVAVVVLFIVCWTPLLMDHVLTAFGLLPVPRVGFLKHMRTAFHLMAYINSCLDPLVYAFISKHFRKSFYIAICSSLVVEKRGKRGHRCQQHFAGPTPLQASFSRTNTRTTSLRQALPD